MAYSMDKSLTDLEKEVELTSNITNQLSITTYVE